MFDRIFNQIRFSDRGASMVEYSLLVVLIAIAGLVAVSHFGGSVANSYSEIAEHIANG